MSALAIFTCRPNSHPFQERHVSLHEQVKIGRSVARARPTPNNAVFDCKVLSRNHALIWYDGEKFYLQDTKSSNGTFVNNTRLSKGSEESPPREIFSGDIIQFGVDVMENSRRVTHGCIIATITLFHPNGNEAKPTFKDASPYATLQGTAIQSQELYQLSQYLQEALHREQMLENKLSTLQRLVQATQESSDSGWQAMVDEDRLLSRLEVLENQLLITSKNQSEDNLRQELLALQEDKSKYETTAKESLRKVLEEKLEAVRKLSEIESSFSNQEDECGHLKTLCETSQQELQSLAEKHDEQLKEIQQLQETLAQAEKKHEEELLKAENENSEIQDKLTEMLKEEATLSAKVEALQADNDFTSQQLTQMKGRMETLKNQINESSDSSVSKETIEDVAENDQVDNEENDSLDNLDIIIEKEELKDKLQETRDQIEQYRAQLEESETRLQESKEKIEQLQSQLEAAQMEIVMYITKVAALEENLRQSDARVNTVMDSTMSDLKIQLEESKKQSDQSTDLTSQLKLEIATLEGELVNYKQQVESLQRNEPVSDNQEVTKCREEITRLNGLLKEAEDTAKRKQEDFDKYQKELEDAITQANAADEQTEKLRVQLDAAQNEARTQGDSIVELKDQLKKAESATQDVTQQMSLLKGELEDARLLAQQSKDETQEIQAQLSKVQAELERVLTAQQEEVTRAAKNQGQLGEMTNQAKESQDEIQSLKDQLAQVKNKLEDVSDAREKEASENKAELEKTRDLLQQSQAHVSSLSAELLKVKQQLENEITAKEQASESSQHLRSEIDKQNERHQAQMSLTEDLLEQSQTESDKLKAQLSNVHTQLKNTETKRTEEATSARKEMEKQVAKNQAEFVALKNECAGLRRRIQNLEADMKTTKKENAKLSSDYNRLQESYKELELLKERLENQEEAWRLNLTDAQKEADNTKQQLQSAHQDVSTWKDKCAECKEEITLLKTDIEEMSVEYTVLADRSRTISICSMVPLMAMMFAILLAFYPTLAGLTATAD